LEGGQISKSKVTAQMVEAMAKKSSEAQYEYQQVVEMYEALTQSMKDAEVSE
jgi:hypothetical protein